MKPLQYLKKLWLIALVALVMPVIHPQIALASANLVFSPASGQVAVGSVWKTTVLVNSDGAVNSIDTTIVFPAANLEATGVDFGGGVFSLSLPGSGSIDNGAGLIRIIQASPSPYSGQGGKIATLSFKTKAVSPADLKFGSTKVIAQDGKGTNVFTGGGTASVNVVAASSAPAVVNATPVPVTTTKTPVITSSSHPNQDAWYKSKSIAYSWTTTGQGYNFTIDQNPATDLPETVVGTAASSSTTVASDGVWYAHVKAQGPNGWSQTAHFKFQIDTSPPGAFQVTTDPSGDVTVLPMVSFADTDSGSGIDHFEAQIDGGAWSRQNSPFKMPSVDSGSHTVLIRAFDRAGNTTDAQTTFTLRQLDAPVITSPENKQLLMLGEQLKVQGKTAPNVQVDVYVNNKKVETTTSDNTGHFSTTQPLLLFAGAYQIVARAINKDGMVSAPSSPVTLTIDARAVKLFGNVWPGWVVLVGVIVIIALLALALGIVGYLLWRKTTGWATRLQGLDDAMARDLALLEAHVDSSIDTSLGAMAPEATSIKSTLNSEISTIKTDVDGLTRHGPTVTLAPKKPSLVSRAKTLAKRITPHLSFGPAPVATPAVVASSPAAPTITMPAAPPPQFAVTSDLAPAPQLLANTPAVVPPPAVAQGQPAAVTPNSDLASVTPPVSMATPVTSAETSGDNHQQPTSIPAPASSPTSTDDQGKVLTGPTTAFPVGTIPENFASPAAESQVATGPVENLPNDKPNNLPDSVAAEANLDQPVPSSVDATKASAASVSSIQVAPSALASEANQVANAPILTENQPATQIQQPIQSAVESPNVTSAAAKSITDTPVPALSQPAEPAVESVATDSSESSQIEPSSTSNEDASNPSSVTKGKSKKAATDTTKKDVPAASITPTVSALDAVNQAEKKG